MDRSERARGVVEKFLAHHGVKGQKWGVRRNGPTSSSTTTSRLRRPETDVTVKQKPGKFVSTAGGKRAPAHGDAVTTAAARQLAKKSTTDALSTKQLQDAVQRMNLEQQYSKLLKQQDRRTRGQRFVKSLLGSNGQQPVGNQPKSAVQVASALAAATKVVA